MPISHKHKIIFIHIPKNGGSSIDRLLEVNRSRPETLFATKRMLEGGIEEVSHLSMLQLKRFIKKNHPKYYPKLDEYYSFAVVRNPWDRMVSEYFHLMRHFSDTAHPVFGKMKKLTFENWIILLEKVFNKIPNLVHPRAFYGSHFRQQVDFVYDENSLLVDDLYRFENYAKNWEEINSKLRLNTPILHLNKNTNRKNRDYRIYYSEKTKKIIERLYSRDIYKPEYRFNSEK
jgi:hypothetical protein